MLKCQGHVHRARAEQGQVQVVRDDEAVVGRKPPLHCDALSVLVVTPRALRRKDLLRDPSRYPAQTKRQTGGVDAATLAVSPASNEA